jgi:hypothetical protein
MIEYILEHKDFFVKIVITAGMIIGTAAGIYALWFGVKIDCPVIKK